NYIILKNKSPGKITRQYLAINSPMRKSTCNLYRSYISMRMPIYLILVYIHTKVTRPSSIKCVNKLKSNSKSIQTLRHKGTPLNLFDKRDDKYRHPVSLTHITHSIIQQLNKHAVRDNTKQIHSRQNDDIEKIAE